MTTLELADRIAAEPMTALYANEIKEMEAYKKHLETLKSKCKELKGTEKQISWASKIREEKLQDTAYKICVNNAKKKGAELGLKNCLQNYDYESALSQIIKAAQSVFKSESWVIIENRF